MHRPISAFIGFAHEAGIASMARLGRLARGKPQPPMICGLLLLLAACGGGGEDGVATAAAAATPTAPQSTAYSAPAEAAPTLRPPALPRASIQADELAVVVAEGDPLSEAIGLAYQRARGLPEANLVRVPVPTGQDAIGVADFGRLKAAVDARLPPGIQATLLTFTQPSRVQGACSMSITSAMALGYSTAHCGGCARTAASAYFDSDSPRPQQDLNLRPSMMLGAATLAEAQALIARGLASENSQPSGTGWLLRTSDAARSVRHIDWQALPATWQDAGLTLRYIDASERPANQQVLFSQQGLMFYFTGLARVDGIHEHQWLPGAVADHLTSAAGVLSGDSGQMPATDWLRAGATASYGTVEEPCNHVEKFPKVSVLLAHYLRGATLIEAYWKSVAWPGQGLFVGDPLARPWPDASSSQIEDGAWVLRTRNLRPGAVYRVEWRRNAGSSWQSLASLTAPTPQITTWRVPLPATTGQVRWLGPCAGSALLTCELGRSD